MAKKTRFAAVCGAALLAVVLLFSALFVVSEADHECGGEHCVICHQLQACQKLLEQISASHATFVGGVGLCSVLLVLVLRTQDIVAADSPVLQRVKLLN